MNPVTDLRNKLEEYSKKLATRGYHLDIERFKILEAQRKEQQVLLETLQAKRNQCSNAVGKAKAAGEECQALIEEVSAMADAMKAATQRLDATQKELHTYLSHIPNLPHDTAPLGNNEEDNEVISQWGAPRVFDFEPKDHVALGEALAGLDFEQASVVSGARFAYLSGDLAKLHRALGQFMLNHHTQMHNYLEVNVPTLVKSSAMYGAGQFPKFEEDAYWMKEEGMSLIPTGEVPLVNWVAERIIAQDALPIKLTCHSLCYRQEAGSHGRDTRGMIRMHQFEKVELVQCVQAENGLAALEEMRAHAESILQALELPYRVVSLCRGDLGFCVQKTYDLEVWIPSQKAYREISSISYCGDFQARRLKARYKVGQEKPQLLHTLNGSGVAIGRALVALMENYQTKTGAIKVPDALKALMATDMIGA